MLHLSTQDVVLSIEKTPVTKFKGFVYQEYNNFFGNNISKDIKDIEKMTMVKLEKQYHMPRNRIDDQRIKLALQIYLGTETNVGTSLFDGYNNMIKTFRYRFDSGYALLNNAVSLHGTEGTVAENNPRRSLYVRYS